MKKRENKKDVLMTALDHARAIDERNERIKENYLKKREMYARLSRNDDFKTFLAVILEDLCSFDFGIREIDAFTQGKRAAASRVISEVCSTREGSRVVADLAMQHFLAYGENAEEANNKEVKEDDE